MKIGVVILAAGSGSRFGADKILARLGGHQVWEWSLKAFQGIEGISQIVLVAGSNRSEIAKLTEVPVIEGGTTRQDSAHKGIEYLAPSCDLILVHDGARPFVSEPVVRRVIAAASENGAAAPTIAVTDTIRRFPEEGSSNSILDRNELAAMQTPQGALTSHFLKAFKNADGNAPVTDDMSLLELAGIQWERVEGSKLNFKITTQEDLQLARGMLRHELRTGLGYDVHRFSDRAGRKCILGGVQFEGAPGLEGHSDADVLSHAVVDALLGSISAGDIGVHFPPSDPQWKDKCSLHFLTFVSDLLATRDWSIVNIDIAVQAEIPKIMPKAKEIIAAMAGALRLSEDRISVKATTNEGLGAIGRKEGIAAFATATVERFVREESD